MNYGYGDTSQYSQGQIYEIQLQGRNLDRKDVTGKSDPFFVLKAATHPGLMTGTTSMTSASYNLNPLKKKKDKSFKKVHKIEKKLDKKGGGWVVVHRSETIMSNLNPTWRPFTINLAQLCNNNFDQPFKLEVFDWDSHGSNDFIGAARLTLRELMTMREVRLINDHRVGFSNTAGTIQVLKCGPVTTTTGGGGGGAPAQQTTQTTVVATSYAQQTGAYPTAPPPTQGYPTQGYPTQGYPTQGYPTQGYPTQPAYPTQGYPTQGYPTQGYPPQGYPTQPYPSQGAYGTGYPQAGYPPQTGFPPQQGYGYPQQQGYPPTMM
jgi:hypothetical protein